MLKKKFIVDENISLKAINSKDAQAIFATINSERSYLGEWLPFVEYTQSVDDTQFFVDDAVLNSDNSLTCTILYNNSFAGLIGLKEIDQINKKTEIGYWLSEKCQHKGIVTKSCRTLIKYAFEDLDIYRMQLNAAVGNEKSQAVAKRLGFTKEGIMRAAELHKRGFLDIVVFSQLKPEWEKQNLRSE